VTTKKVPKVKKPKKPKKDKPVYDEHGNWIDQKRLVIGAIRRLFRQAPQFKEASEASRVEVPRYNKDGGLSKKPYVKKTCEVCGQLFSSTNIAIDHIDTMVPLYLTNEDLDYNEIVASIICKRPNLQRICNPRKGKKHKPKFLEFCHQKKTHKENFIRDMWQKFFKEDGVTDRATKEFIHANRGAELEAKWEVLYKQELENKLKEIAELEEKRRLREEKKRLKELSKLPK
jgi:hypothetical protein